MQSPQDIFLGTDSGATSSKTAGVWADGTPISADFLQIPTNAQRGTAAVVKGWIDGLESFLTENALLWSQVRGVGLAIPGPYQRYGVLARSANLPPEFEGWNFLSNYSEALARAARRPVQLVAGNDGKLGGVAEAHFVCREKKASVLMLAPGSGLGSAYIDKNGVPLEGDTLAGMEAAHMPAALHLLGVPSYQCGCGRDWGCVEVYTTISGLPYLLADALQKHPEHELAKSTRPVREKVLSLRGLAQSGDDLASGIFDFQAKALGLHLAALVIALDPEFVVIGGGLMDPKATSPSFRDRYLRIVRETALTRLWPSQRLHIKILAASLGELSQAIGAALVALRNDTGVSVY